MSNEQEWGIPMTEELRQSLVAFELSKWLEFPCPVCGKAFNGVQDLIDSEAVHYEWRDGKGVAAHLTCFEKTKGNVTE